MTRNRPAGQPWDPAPRIPTAVRSQPESSSDPVVVLTYTHAGDALLANIISGSPQIVSTRATGLLPLCLSAVSTWQSIENRGAASSALAVKSTRLLIKSMTAVLTSSTGATRWCEIAYTGTAAAEAFLSIFPDAKFLCLHRRLSAVFHEAAQAYPWGLGDSPFWQYAYLQPGNNVGAIAAYWADHTAQLIEFEARHSQRVIRVRYEDLINDKDATANAVSRFLGLDAREVPALGASSAALDQTPSADFTRQLDRIPEWLRTRVGELHAELNYDSPRRAVRST
jgi:hypothetical protein